MFYVLFIFNCEQIVYDYKYLYFLNFRFSNSNTGTQKQNDNYHNLELPPFFSPQYQYAVLDL